MIDILKDHWLLFLIGQYPHGPLGGLAMTLFMATVGSRAQLPHRCWARARAHQLVPRAARARGRDHPHGARPAPYHVHLLGLLRLARL